MSLIVPGLAILILSAPGIPEPRSVTTLDGRPQSDLGGYTLERGDRSETVILYSMSSPPGRTPRFVLQREVRQAGDVSETWTDSEQCPTVAGVVEDRGDIISPNLTLLTPRLTPQPGGRRQAPPPQIRDGDRISVWGPARGPDRSSARILIEESSGLVADWVIFAREALSACWVDERPQYLLTPDT